ncbi:MAG: SUMF1/EgtB/PvdO family nonheme iron enzyme [Paludibacter sp.]
MKIRTLTKIAVFTLVIAAVFAFGKKNKGASSITGWKYNDPAGTDFVVKEGLKTQTPMGMVAIEGGSYTIGEKAEFVTQPRDNRQRRITVSSFYMDQYEIRNIDWREYSNWMKVVFDKSAPQLVKKATPNVNTWREQLAYNEPYLQNYFTHPSFNNYPIVGVTWEQAVDYCAWRTDRVNELALINAGIIVAPNFASLENMPYDSIRSSFIFNTQKYLLQNSYNPTPGAKARRRANQSSPKVDMADGIMFSDYRLPTEAEWEYAAYAISSDANDIVAEGKIYPWAGQQTRKTDRKNMGRIQANYVRGRGDMGTSGIANDRATITAPVDAYFPNDFGLYNMAGNVNEWVLDVYRASSFDDMSEYNSFRGNVYIKQKVSGKDTYGRDMFEIDSLGRIAFEITEDLRNFKDPDPNSKIPTDTLDISDVLRPVINEKSRIYKGGSWKDRVYWLNPSTRRYLDQSMSANDIGFRCAMSMIGDIPQIKKRK